MNNRWKFFTLCAVMIVLVGSTGYWLFWNYNYPNPPVAVRIGMSQSEVEHNESVVMEITLTNIGYKTLFISKPDLRYESLFLYVVFPNGTLMHYIGPVYVTFPPSITIGRGESRTFSVELQNIPFGTMSMNYLPDGYMGNYFQINQSGSYKIYAIYKSQRYYLNKDLKGGRNNWQGTVKSNEIEFLLK